MTASAAQAAAFYREALAAGTVFGVQDDSGFPAPQTAAGVRAMPFWSRRSRAQRIIDTVPAYSAMRITELELAVWLDRWLPGLERDGLLVGLNWSGPDATGYDLTPTDVRRNLDARRGLDTPG